jgi:hypothetical protein
VRHRMRPVVLAKPRLSSFLGKRKDRRASPGAGATGGVHFWIALSAPRVPCGARPGEHNKGGRFESRSRQKLHQNCAKSSRRTHNLVGAGYFVEYFM